MGLNFAAIVPMRHTSERVPGKNYRNFNGLPLYHWILKKLLDCPEIGAVMIDTDSALILDDARTHFPDVIRYTRPKHLQDGMTPMNEVLLNSVDQIEAEYYLQTHSTNPLLKVQTISRAIGEFKEHLPQYDSLFSVTRIQTRLWDSAGKPVNHDPANLLRTQDLEPFFEENSCIYLFSKDSLQRDRNRIGRRPMMFEIEGVEAYDIDNELDFRVAEALAIITADEVSNG